jgi:hypothetical protein
MDIVFCLELKWKIFKIGSNCEWYMEPWTTYNDIC